MRRGAGLRRLATYVAVEASGQRAGVRARLVLARHRRPPLFDGVRAWPEEGLLILFGRCARRRALYTMPTSSSLCPVGSDPPIGPFRRGMASVQWLGRLRAGVGAGVTTSTEECYPPSDCHTVTCIHRP